MLQPTLTNVNNIIAVEIPVNVGIIIEGEGPATRLYIPNNPSTSTTALIQLVNSPSSVPSNGYQSPRPILRNFRIINNNNTSYNMIAILSNYSSNNSSGLGPIFEDIEVYNPLNTPLTGIYVGVAGPLSNTSAPLGAVVRGYRFLTQNSNGSDLAIGFDTGARGVITDSLLYSSTVNGWNNIAIFLGTGNIHITNTEILGFNTIIHADATDSQSFIDISNSAIGVNRSGTQTLDNAANSLGFESLVNLTSSANLKLRISNSWISSGGNPYVGIYNTD